MRSTRSLAAGTAIFAAGFLAGSLAQRPAVAQLGDLKERAMERAGEQGGALGAAAQLGTQISDMQKHVEGLQKNLDAFKKIQAMLGG